jgi:hypothetical protein
MCDGGCSGIGNGVLFHHPFGSRKALTPVCLFWPGSHLVLSGPLVFGQWLLSVVVWSAPLSV